MTIRSWRYFIRKRTWPNGLPAAYIDGRWKGTFYSEEPPPIPLYSIRRKSKKYRLQPIEFWKSSIKSKNTTT